MELHEIRILQIADQQVIIYALLYHRNGLEVAIRSSWAAGNTNYHNVPNLGQSDRDIPLPSGKK